MPHRHHAVFVTVSAIATGPAAIAWGLVLLVVSIWLPATPVMTALSLVAMGATDATLARFRGTQSLLPVLLLHIATYGSLYALFVGATLHAASRSGAGVGTPAAADLVTSALLMAIAATRAWGGLALALAHKR